MMQLMDVQTLEHRGLTLEDYAADAKFVAAVASLRQEAKALRAALAGRTVWMVNSAAQGGGVAEMLPRLVSMLCELGIETRWSVIHSDEPRFFELTKRLHNLIHGENAAGLHFDAADRELFERVNRLNAEALKPHLAPQDLLIVHDPQPVALGQMLQQDLGLAAAWRCHIGLDTRTEATRAAWRFLRPYLQPYERAIFSVPEYIPSFLAGRTSIIYPALDPLSHKNRDLSAHKLVGVMCNSGLQTAYEPVATPSFSQQVKRVLPDGQAAAVPGEMGLLFRPTIVQVSRWDRLKGWIPLLEAFVRLKQRLHDGAFQHVDGTFINRLELCRLVLAGPDPASVADDPEGVAVLEQICARYRALDPALQQEIMILQLPMESRKENALIVNALQRCASIVVQNSIREGFGLTVTEAMWKHMAVLGTRACGIRLQVRDGIDGYLTEDPEDAGEIADHLAALLTQPVLRQTMGRNGQRRAYDEFLIFNQVSRYLQLLSRMTAN